MKRGRIRVKINAHDVHNDILERFAEQAIAPAAADAVTDGLQILADEIRARAPVDTGALRDSIEVEPPRGTSSYGRVVIGGNGHNGDTYYAMFIEFGTVLMPASPFIRPSAIAARARIGRAIGRKLRALR